MITEIDLKWYCEVVNKEQKIKTFPKSSNKVLNEKNVSKNRARVTVRRIILT